MNKLQNLAEIAGISSSYIDKTGQTHNTTDDVRRFFLNAMGYTANNVKEIQESISRLTQPQILPPVLTFYDNEEIKIKLPDNQITYEIILKNENQNIICQQKAKTEIIIPILQHGYYILTVQKDGIDKAVSFLIYAPVLCYQPDFIKNKEHIYGVSLMLYALRSQNSIGIGDFSDLAEIIKITAQNGGDVVGINPLGVMSPYTLKSPLFDVLKGDVSPYRSLSRLFINYVYLDLRSEPDFQDSAGVQSVLKNPEVINEIKRLNDSPYVLYAATLQLKLRLLGMMYEHFIRENAQTRKRAFTEYKNEKGTELYQTNYVLPTKSAISSLREFDKTVQDIANG